MKTLNILSIGMVLTIVMSSCNKQVKIEKNLWKNGGEWKIERFDSQQTSTYAPDNFSSSLLDYGTFQFNEDGSGIYVFTGGGNYESGPLTYSNTEDELVMYFLNSSYVFAMNWEKNNIEINREVAYSNNTGSGIYSEKYVLKKK